ncbi:Crp/Fnr family transcriptional regulator [Variovorax boronicumulans]|uniref:Crp/Fnr family transcriptional regulator n=1 Tax=Variovorax boronicumulans TaxID=436515 RepID=UPI001C59932A
MSLRAPTHVTAAHRDAMEANPWFAALPRAQRDGLLSVAEVHHLVRGAMLYRQGDGGDGISGGFYGLASGFIKVSTLRQDGREAILAMLEPGNWFGEISLIDGSLRSHDATALADAEVLVVPHAAFARQMGELAFAQAMALLLANRVRGLYSLMEDATLRDLRSRVARRLLALARGDVTQSPQMRRQIALPQEAIAMMLGVTRQTLSKELHALAGQGVLTVGYGRIEIESFEALQAAAG